MANGVKPANLATGLAVMILLLISFLGGIYGTIKHRERNKKKRLQSIVKHELAAEQARQARENVERELRREEEERRGRQSRRGDIGDVERGPGVGESKSGSQGRSDSQKGVEKEMETEIGKVKVTLNGVEIDPETGREHSAVADEMHDIEVGPKVLDHPTKAGNVLIVDEEKGQAPRRKKKRSKFSIYGKR